VNGSASSSAFLQGHRGRVLTTRADAHGRGKRHSLMLAAATGRATGRELIWGLGGVSREVRHWSRKATQIPNPELRAHAISALGRKRGNINGAALFWTLTDRCSTDLLGALVAYEVLADYLDCVSERGAQHGLRNGRQLHLAMVEALDPQAAISDYYRYHHSRADGGFLRALVESCRAACLRLPSYAAARPFIAQAAGLSAVLAINHEPDPALRERALESWAAEAQTAHQLADPREQSWFERTAGASAWLTVLAMLALAADPADRAHSPAELEQIYDAYLHVISPAAAMLDSYCDLVEDLAGGEHSYISHYPSIDVAVERVSLLVRRSRVQARRLPRGERHAVLVACMIAFYLSKDSVRAPALRAHTHELRRAGGAHVAVLAPVLRVWRTAYRQRAA
jgi:tetraprenyl-beta-curcumene synthase